MNIVASIQARLGSSRLPGKVLFPLGNRRILQWVVERTETAAEIDQTVVAIGDRPENDAVTEFCERTGIQTVVGSEENLLVRHNTVAEQTDCDLLVRITADCPFVPPEEIDRVVETHQDAALTTNNTDAMPTGTAVDAIDPTALETLVDEGKTHPVAPLRRDRDRWHATLSDSPRWTELGNAHTAVDTPSDYWHLTDAVDAVGTDPYEVTRWAATRESATGN